MDKHLHIVCLDSPSPPDYGGAIDMHYKIIALSNQGIKVHLHYFEYRSGRNVDDLVDFCFTINRYKRQTGIRGLSLKVPYIIQSRTNPELIAKLNEDNHPILLEGLHCTGILPSLTPGRTVVIRQHNNEPVYYSHLAKSENNFFKKIYYQLESDLLQRYQLSLSKNMIMACLSAKDADQLATEYGFSHTAIIPCFIPWQQLKGRTGHGNFCLYHGNMRVRENEQAASWLIKNVFRNSPVPFIIAGNGISENLIKKAEGQKNISFISDPPLTELDELIRQAHVHVLPSFNSTGVKLKLLHALIEGRFCITNSAGVVGSGLKTTLQVVENADQWRHSIQDMMSRDFDADHQESRSSVLELYNNRVNAEKLTALW